MPTGLYFLINISKPDLNTGFSRSLYEGKLNFLFEETPDKTGTKSGEDADALSDAEFLKRFPQAVQVTVQSMNNLMNLPVISKTPLRDKIESMRNRVAKISEKPTEEDTEVFKIAEVFHAMIVKAIDEYAKLLSTSPKDKKSTPEQRSALMGTAYETAVKDANSKVTAQVQKVPFLKRIFGARQEPPLATVEKIEKIVGGNLAASFMNDLPKVKSNDIYGLVKSPAMQAVRPVQGEQLSAPPQNIPETPGAETAAGGEGSENSKNFESLKKRLADYKTTFKQMVDRKMMQEDEYDLFEIVAEDIEEDKGKSYDDLVAQMNDAQKQMFTTLVNDAGKNFAELRFAMKKVARTGAGTEAGGKEGTPGAEAAEEVPTGASLRQMLFTKDNKKRAKVSPEAAKVKTSLMNLVQDPSWQTFTDTDPKNNKVPAKTQGELMNRLRAVQAALRDLKVESKDAQEDLLVERWQRLAGLL